MVSRLFLNTRNKRRSVGLEILTERTTGVGDPNHNPYLLKFGVLVGGSPKSWGRRRETNKGISCRRVFLQYSSSVWHMLALFLCNDPCVTPFRKGPGLDNPWSPTYFILTSPLWLPSYTSKIYIYRVRRSTILWSVTI